MLNPRRFAIGMSILLSWACLTSAAPASPLKAVVASYLDIQTRLAADKLDGVDAAAAIIVREAGAMGSDGTAIVEAAKAVEAAADLRATRAAFAGLSEAVITAAKAAGWKDLGEVKLAYCSMVGSPWLQKEQEVRNPYFGSSMLACGVFRDPKK